MEPLHIKATNDTPRVLLDPESELFEISGRSLPEDVVTFYEPVLDWLDEYAHKPLPKTEFNFRYIYFNTATSKLVQEILFRLENISEAGNEVLVMWYYEQDDEDMLDMGLEFKENINIPFEIIGF